MQAQTNEGFSVPAIGWVWRLAQEASLIRKKKKDIA